MGLDVVHASIAGGDPRLGGLIDAERDLRGLENDEVRQPGYGLEYLALGVGGGDYLLEDGFDGIGFGATDIGGAGLKPLAQRNHRPKDH